jgi:hypothetical protein
MAGKYRAGRTIIEFPAPLEVDSLVDRWLSSSDSVKELSPSAGSRTFANANSVGHRPYEGWRISLFTSSRCRVEGWAIRERFRWWDWLSHPGELSMWARCPREIRLDIDPQTYTGYNGAAEHGRDQLNQLLQVLDQPPVPAHRDW